MTSAPAIGFDYHPSRLPVRLLGVVAALAVMAIALSGAPVWTKLLLAAGTLGCALRATRRLSRSTIAGVGLAGENWTLYRVDRSESPAILASFRVLGACVLLRLKTTGRVHVLLLAPDNSDADVRRRLRMRLASLRSAGHAADL
jgi:toxin CptA